jgi:hypothetical protein
MDLVKKLNSDDFVPSAVELDNQDRVVHSVYDEDDNELTEEYNIEQQMQA